MGRSIDALSCFKCGNVKELHVMSSGTVAICEPCCVKNDEEGNYTTWEITI